MIRRLIATADRAMIAADRLPGVALILAFYLALEMVGQLAMRIMAQ